jgi:hypothetical protein
MFADQSSAFIPSTMASASANTPRMNGQRAQA